MSEGFFDTLLDYCGGKVVAALEAYFDESGRASGLLCVAGVVFAPAQAKHFRKEFNGEFGRYGGFHMADLVARRQGFKGISERERDRLVKMAVGIFKKRFSYGVAVGVKTAEYNQLSPKFMRGFKSPYSFLCHLAMIAVPRLMGNHGDTTPVRYIFEAGHADQAEAEFFVGLMATDPETSKAYLYSGHSFLPKADAVPLQAADFLAWEVAKFKDESLDGYREIRKSLLSVVENDTKRFHWSFVEGDALARGMRRYRAMGIKQIEEYRNGKRDGRVQEVRRGNGRDLKGRSRKGEGRDENGKTPARGTAEG